MVTTKRRRRVGVVISGSGSNMTELISAAGAADYPAQIVVVVSNRPDAPGLAKAAASGVPTAIVDHRAFADRQAFEIALHAELVRYDVETVCLAGFMRLLTPWFIAAWRDQLINIHPALLPLYPGLDTHARALADGVKLHGCTVHFVREETDTGPIIGQAAIPVLSSDTPQTLAVRVLAAEHRLYPTALAMVAADRVQILQHDDGRETTRIDGEYGQPGMLVWPAG